MVLLITTFSIQDVFTIKLTANRKFDMEFRMVANKFIALTQTLTKFDQALEKFLQALSHFYIGTFTLPSAILTFYLLVKPYHTGTTNKPPFI